MAMDDMPGPLPPRRPVEDFLVPPRSGQRLPRLSPPKIVGERKKVVSMSPDVKLSAIELGVAAPPQSSMSEAVREAVRDMHVADHDAQVEQLRDTLHQHAVETALFFSALGGEAKIGPSEFRAAVARLKWGVSDSVCDVLFRAMDSDGSGDTTAGEYSRWLLRDTLRRKAGSAMQQLVEMDTDGNGTVERWEFRRAMGAIHVLVPDRALLDELFDEIDVKCVTRIQKTH